MKFGLGARVDRVQFTATYKIAFELAPFAQTGYRFLFHGAAALPKFTIINPPLASAQQIEFEDFIDISKGLSISSMAATSDDSIGPDFLELGLSKTFNLRIQANGNALVVSLVRTLNIGEFAPVRVELVAEGERVTAELVEKRIHHLRQLYALAFLIEGGLENSLAVVLASNPGADIEHELVPENDKLVIQEAAPGSLILSLVAKSKHMLKAIKYACAVPFKEGRAALLLSVRADTALKQLDVQAKAQDNMLKSAVGVIELAKRIDTIKDKDTRELIRLRLLSDISGMTAPSGAGINPYSLSPTPLTYFVGGKIVEDPQTSLQIGQKKK